MQEKAHRHSRRLIVSAIAAALCAACATPEPVAPAPQPTAPAPIIVEVTPETRAQSQKLAQQDALDLLQRGDEATAKEVLERALRLDPNNELAKKLIDQIKADAHKELGSVSFPYMIRSEDTLGKLAQQYLGDKHRFYLLAKYNDIRVPNKLSVGQVIRIPGQAPKPSPVARQAEPKPAPPPEPVKTAPEPPPKPPEPPKPPPEPPKPVATEQNKLVVVQRLSREAEACHRRQDLKCEIQKWDQVLLSDPDNQTARLKRENAIKLQRNIEKLKQ